MMGDTCASAETAHSGYGMVEMCSYTRVCTCTQRPENTQDDSRKLLARALSFPRYPHPDYLLTLPQTSKAHLLTRL